MGGCCSIEVKYGSVYEEEEMERKDNYNNKKIGGEDDFVRVGDNGASVRLQGSSKNISMFTQQGRKGINQDAMTVWENFTGDKDTVFCGVFDGHGPAGHKIARHVRDNLPSKLSTAIKLLKRNHEDYSNGSKSSQNPFFRALEASLVKAYEELDDELGLASAVDSYSSGATAVNIIKKGEHLIIANLGDSRAVLCTRDDRNQLVPVQLTTDLKPEIAGEAERIRNCKGRVFAMDEEPDVYRVWMPDEDCPGLAMARAFGDFCLKGYGLISIPEISYRKLTREDQFVVLATDGVWDVLTNSEVIRTVACASKKEMAAKMLVSRAVRAWRTKYPGSKIDDCAAICLFLGHKPLLTKSKSDTSYCSSISQVSYPHAAGSRSMRSQATETELSVHSRMSLEEYSALKGVSRVNSLVKLPRFARGLSRRRSGNRFEDIAG
ncbi:putative protein phosphatase 2C 65 [Citrus sinensis]|uniref:probable protein phosphatase 2C 65 n=1 Tax=Citrus sinensis TaxID=2711 RepID=UPI000D62AD33|nr:probable protein phosphatase 2C 65 [Citrus sinensis]KAH9673200.1 putative protein phosphatase 2C 65 [Citrus sinensis]